MFIVASDGSKQVLKTAAGPCSGITATPRSLDLLDLTALLPIYNIVICNNVAANIIEVCFIRKITHIISF